MPHKEGITKRAWKTIDYIGGGYVLQVRMTAHVDKELNYRDEFKDAEVFDVEDKWEVEIDRDRFRPVGQVYQRHRIVHLSELEDVNFTEFLGEAQLRSLSGEEE